PATSSDDMTAKPWYSGERGVTQLTGAIGSLVNDVRRVRRAWHWDTPRPHTWPERGAVIPPSESDLGWARQEPVRTIRYLIQHGLLLPFTEAMSQPKVEGREWVKELDRPVIFAANHSSHADTSRTKRGRPSCRSTSVARNASCPRVRSCRCPPRQESASASP